MDELTREFLIESQEGLDRMERCLTELETRPDDAALVGDIFRSVHTIKGTTGFLGFKRLEKLAHSGENLLGLLRDGKLAADRRLITGLLHLLDGLRSILKLIETEAGEGSGEDTELIAQLEALADSGSSIGRQRIAGGEQAKSAAGQANKDKRRQLERSSSFPGDSGEAGRTPQDKTQVILSASTPETEAAVAKAKPASTSTAALQKARFASTSFCSIA